MRILDGCLKGLQWAIVAAALLLIWFIAYFNVVEYQRVFLGLGLGGFAVWVGMAVFCLVQAMEIRPILLKHKHNRCSEMIAFAEKQGCDAKPLIVQLKEEAAIRTKRIRRAVWMAYLFTFIDLALCVFLLFTPIIKPGVSLMTVLLTMNMSLIVWPNVFKTLGTVWLLPALTKMLISESNETGLPNLSGAFAALKAKMKPVQGEKREAQLQARTVRRQAPQSQPGFVVVPYAQPQAPKAESNGKHPEPVNN
ncbi:MAG: hypothetical protein KME45_03215 [Stenomitos rutilans HA7619-LM2]|jgi:hypothetical protein|nr:hypothetical protein [Stenomitos rutilans HA7619-LM2]MBW4469395.1 hypothetical protein [Stenomitos rutilans HA7619-LM2]